MGLEYGSLFKNWELAIAKKLIREFKQRWRCLDTETTEDLLQECLTHWHFNRNKYDSKKDASLKTFMSKVVIIKLTQIVRRNGTDKRKVSHLAVPLKEDEEEEDLPDSGEAVVRIRGDPDDHAARSDLKIELTEAIQKLTPRQKKLCRLMMEEGLTPTEISKHLKLHRKTVYKELKRIRKLFMKEGFRDYLK